MAVRKLKQILKKAKAVKVRKLKKDDEVVVIAGKYKGRRGTIEKVLADGRLIVSGINIVIKHQKPDPNRNIPGGRVEREAPIQASNVAIFNPASGKADRVAYKIIDGKKYRVFKSNQEVVDSTQG